MATDGFKKRLAGMGYSSYGEYLKGKEWAEFKERYKASNRLQTCKACSSPHVNLHHVTYIRLGREELDDVVPLCKRHHDQVHRWLKDNKKFARDTDKALEAITRRRTKCWSVEDRYRYLTKSEKTKLPVEVRRQLVGFCHLCGNGAKKNNRTCSRCVVIEMAKKGYVPKAGCAAGYAAEQDM